MVQDGCDSQLLGEIEGALCLRLSGEKRKTQVTAFVTQDDKEVRRITLQTFQSAQGIGYRATKRTNLLSEAISSADC